MRDKLKEENKLYNLVNFLRKNLRELDISNIIIDFKNKKYDNISKTFNNIDINKRECGSLMSF